MTHLGKPSKLVINRSNSFLECLLECSADTHHLTHALHAAAQKPANAVELLEVPTRNLDHDIVHTWFKARTGDFGDGIPDLVEGYSKAEFGRDKCERVSGSF